MTIEPQEYDIDELRIRPPVSPAADMASADEARRAAQYRELLEREATGDGGGRPYLAAIPERYAAEMVVFDWLEYLYRKAGFRGAVEAIGFYRSLGWITADVEDRLDGYLRAFEESTGEEYTTLDRADHVCSLLHIARLAAIE